MTVLFFYACYGSIFFDTVLFNSDYMAPLLDPMIGKQGIIYSNNFLYFHNIIVATTLILVYACLCTLWSSREMNTSSLHVSKFQRSVRLTFINSKKNYQICSDTSSINLYFINICNTSNFVCYNVRPPNSEMVFPCFRYYLSAKWR